jgi:hypothetical protein
LEDAGFLSSDPAASFLSEFYGLRVEHPPTVELSGHFYSCYTEFDPLRVGSPGSARVAARCSEVAGKRLFPVGVDGFHLTIYITPDGSFNAGMDERVYFYADNHCELFRKMAAGERPVLIGSWIQFG